MTDADTLAEIKAWLGRVEHREFLRNCFARVIARDVVGDLDWLLARVEALERQGEQDRKNFEAWETDTLNNAEDCIHARTETVGKENVELRAALTISDEEAGRMLHAYATDGRSIRNVLLNEADATLLAHYLLDKLRRRAGMTP